MVDKIAYFGQPNCRRISNGTVELIVTTDIGPRIIRYGFAGEENILAELPEVSLQTSLGEWKPWGGHRLWTAPEAMPRSYSIDNQPIDYEILGDRKIRLVQRAQKKTADIQKELIIALDPEGTGASIYHKISNANMWGIDAAPWALTIMNGGGTAIIPQEPYRSHDEYLLPARPLVLWHFTDLNDPRLTIGQNFICLRSDAAAAAPQKIGVANKQGWAAYLRGRTVFVKQFAFDEKAAYPDFNSNNEVYTAGSFIELESLGPMRHLEPGESAEHEERWNLFRVAGLERITDAALRSIFDPILAEIRTKSLT